MFVPVCLTIRCLYMSYFVYTRVSLPHDVCTRVANDVCILLLHLTVSVRCTYFADDVCVIHAFAYNAVEYLHRYNFDGLDVDWEFPADGGSPAGDKQRFTNLLKVYTRTHLERLMYLIFKVFGSYGGQNRTTACENNKW